MNGEISKEEERRILEQESVQWVPVADAPKWLSHVDVWIEPTAAVVALNPSPATFEPQRLPDCDREDGKWIWRHEPPSLSAEDRTKGRALLNSAVTYWRYPPAPPNFNWDEYDASFAEDGHPQ